MEKPTMTDLCAPYIVAAGFIVINRTDPASLMHAIASRVVRNRSTAESILARAAATDFYNAKHLVIVSAVGLPVPEGYRLDKSGRIRSI
jgi:hypothetical protein